MIKYIDAHCHILSDEQMSDAIARGVGHFIVNATKPSDWDTVEKLADNKNIYGAIGIHPWFVTNLTKDWDDKLVEKLIANASLMVGEIGLDKNHPDMERQIAVFKRQLQIAKDLGRATHIHCVGAWGKMMEILRGSKLPSAMVFHCFSGSPELIKELTDMGAYFSFGVGICDKNHKTMRTVVSLVPKNRILVESDAPDVVLPDTIPDTVMNIAIIRDVLPKVMAETIYDNTIGLIDDKSI